MTTYNGPQFKNYRSTRHKIHEIQQRYYISIDPFLLADLDVNDFWVTEEPTSDGGILIRAAGSRNQQQK